MFFISRVTKDPQVRQLELIDAAYELFISLGYQNTNVKDIVQKVGVAQGTFYYYFPSKEAILEAAIERELKNMVAEIQAVDPGHITPLAKLELGINRFFKLCYNGKNSAIARMLYQEKQLELINKLWRQSQTITNPLLIPIIEQCNREGLTNAPHISETLWFLGSILGALLESSSPLEYGHETDPEKMNKKIAIAEKLITSLFSIPAGSIRLDIDP